MPGSRKIILREHGAVAEDTVEVVESDSLQPGKGQILVRMRYSPVNPADINVLQGSYGLLPDLPDLPATPGNEGAGEVVSVGEDVGSFEPGDPVIPLAATGCWRQHLLLEASSVFLLPRGIDLQQASMLRVNPLSAQLLLEQHQSQPGTPGYIAQNAANSAVGQCLIQLADLAGIRTLNFARGETSREMLRKLGAYLVFSDDRAGLTEAKNACGETPPTFAANAVGGESALRLMDLLGNGGTLVTYGGMAKQPLKVPNSFLIFKNLRLWGFWLNHWLETADDTALTRRLHTLAEHVLHGRLRVSVEEIYPFTSVREAVRQAQQPGRSGKILLAF